MRNRINLLGLLAILIAGALFSVSTAFVSAQSAPATGITVQQLGQDQSAVAPGRVLSLSRRTFAPGADSGAHAAQGPVVLYVEDGYIGFKVVKGEALVTWGTSQKTEGVPAGSEVKLMPGDEVSYDQGVVHDVRNIGVTPAVTLESRLNPSTPAK